MRECGVVTPACTTVPSVGGGGSVAIAAGAIGDEVEGEEEMEGAVSAHGLAIAGDGAV